MQDNTSNPSNPYDQTPKDSNPDQKSTDEAKKNDPVQGSDSWDAPDVANENVNGDGLTAPVDTPSHSGWSPVSSEAPRETPAADGYTSPSAPHSGPYNGYGQPHAPYGPPQTGNASYAPPVGPPVEQAPQYGHPAYGQQPYTNQPYPGQPYNSYGVVPVSPPERDEEISKWIGVGGLTSWIWAWFIGMPFIIPIAAGIVGLVFAYRARSGGRRAQAGFVMGWINAVGAVVLGLLLVVLFFSFVAFATANNIH